MSDDFKYTIDGPILVKNLVEFTTNLKNEYQESEVAEVFEGVFLDRSNLIVFEVINIIWILRSLIRWKDVFD